MRLAFKIVIVVIAFALLLAGIFFYLNGIASSLASTIGSTPPAVSGPVSLLASAAPSQVYGYNGSAASVVYSLLSYSISNATNSSVAMSIYPSNPFAKIYLLNVTGYCSSCFDENALRSSLEASLLNQDLLRNSSSFSYINESSLASVPAGSIVIIPSGLMPIYMTNGTSPELLSLLQNGDIVVYAGLNLSRSIGPNGIIFINSQDTMTALRNSGLDTVQTASSGQFEVNQSFHNPTFEFSGGFRYGNATYVSAASGTMLAFSNSPTNGWTSVGAMANDIAGAIGSDLWLNRMGNRTMNVRLSQGESGSLGVFAMLAPERGSSNVTFIPDANGTYDVVTVKASNPQSSVIRRLVLKNAYTPRGAISLPGTIGATQNVPVQLQVQNSSQNLLVHLNIYNLNQSFVGSVPIGFITGSLGVVKYHAFSIPGGYYIVSLEDFNNNNYGSALFYVSNVSITPTSLDFKNGTFTFSAYSNGIPLSNVSYGVNINGLYAYAGQITDGVISYKLPQGTLIGFGTENFHFSMINTNYTYTTSYSKQVLNIPPIYIEFGVALLVVLLLNFILKPPNRDEYYIDVPEFPPSKREKVKVAKSAVLGVFDKVNYYHRWKYMPLTADEVKMGIGNSIRANNMPISITMQNANGLLARLAKDGAIASVGGYYAPAEWVEASKHNVEYLTIFRKMRDYCVSHAVLFTDLDYNDSADMLITKDTKQIGIFIYSKGAKMRKLTVSSDSKVAIVFLNDDSAREFVNRLYASYDKEAEVLKLGIEYNYVKLVDSDHLDQLVL